MTAALAASISCTHPAPAPQQAAVVAAPPTPGAALTPVFSLVPVDVARTGLIASFVVPALERSLASGVALVKRAAPLPLDARGVQDMLLAQAGLPPEVATHLDLKEPIAGAAVAGGGGRPTLTAFTFACHSAADVQALFTALGRTIARRGAAVELENAGGDHGWFLPQGNVVVFADSDDALVRAGSLALEARRRTDDDVSVLFYPDVLARAGGSDVKTALSRFVSEIEERAAAGGSRLGGEGTRQLREIADYLQDVATAELALNLNEASGARLISRLHPRPSSKLEALARETRAQPIDAVMLSAGAPGKEAGKESGKEDSELVVSAIYGAGMIERLAMYRARLPSDGSKPSLAAGRMLDALREGLTGAFVVSGRLRPPFFAQGVYPARDAAGTNKIGEALGATDKAAVAALLAAIMQGEAVNLTVKKANQERLGKLRAVHATLAIASPKGREPSLLAKVFGPAGVDAYAAVVPDNRVALTVGAGAKARLVAIAGGKPGNATPLLADIVAKAGGRSAFFALDLRQLLALGQLGGGDPRLRPPGNAFSVPMPIFGGSAGDGQGQTLTLDLTVPPVCFTGLGALVQSAMFRRD